MPPYEHWFLFQTVKKKTKITKIWKKLNVMLLSAVTDDTSYLHSKKFLFVAWIFFYIPVIPKLVIFLPRSCQVTEAKAGQRSKCDRNF